MSSWITCLPPKPNHCVVPESKILNRMWSLSAELASDMVTVSAEGDLPSSLPVLSEGAKIWEVKHSSGLR